MHEINSILIIISVITIILLIYNNFFIIGNLSSMQINPEMLIALSSMVISFTTLWITILSPSRIKIKIGKTIAIYFANIGIMDKTLNYLAICISLNILNKGARAGVIDNFAIRMSLARKNIFTGFIRKCKRWRFP